MIRIESNVGQAIRNLEKFKGRTEKALEKSLRKEAKAFVKSVQDHQFRGHWGKLYLRRITGKAINGWKIRESGTGINYKIRIFNDVFYVAIHEIDTQRLRLRKAFKEWFKTAKRIIEGMKNG